MADDDGNTPVPSRYDIALLYLNQAGYDLDVAVEAYLADEKWEKEHPIQSTSKGKAKQGRRIGTQTGLTEQIR